MIIFHETKPANLREASRLRKQLSRRLDDFRLPQPVVWSLLVALSEILANILKHSDPAPGFIAVRVDLLGAQLRIEIKDDGGPFYDFIDLVAGADAKGGQDFCETGRGLGLIGDGLEQMSYYPGSINCFVAWKPLFSQKPLVLIVEDDETLLDIYSHFLRDLQVVKAQSCDVARSVIRELDVSVIVADLHLGDGLATSLLKEVEANWELCAPIILISGSEDSAGPQDALERGAEVFLAKPVSGDQLRAAVDVAISRSARRTAHLARYFARKVDGFLTAELSPFIFGHDVVMARAGASAGGGDLVFEYKFDDRRRIVLLDVMGHGVSAKAWALAYAALCRGLCHAQPADKCSDFLTRLAEIAWSDRAMDGVVATALTLDMYDDGHIEIASAGHPLPVILGAGFVNQISIDGALLGVLAPGSFEMASIILDSDQRLVLVTDGVDAGDVAAGGILPAWLTDACRDPDIFCSRGRELELICSGILGPQPKDDWTIIVIGPAAEKYQA